MSNISEVVNKEINLTAINRGVLASGLDKLLNGPEIFTVFAPSDMAFGKLESGVMAYLLMPENKVKLTDLLNYHIISGKIDFKDLIDGAKLKSLNGKELTVKRVGNKVSLNGSTIQNRDMETSNGVIHSLDTVLENNLQVRSL